MNPELPPCPDDVLLAASVALYESWGYRKTLDPDAFERVTTEHARKARECRIIADHAYRAGLTARRASDMDKLSAQQTGGITGIYFVAESDDLAVAIVFRMIGGPARYWYLRVDNGTTWNSHHLDGNAITIWESSNDK